PSSRTIRLALSFLLAASAATPLLLGSAPSDEEVELKVEEGREFTNGVGMTLKRIPRGTFTMGSPAGEKGRGDNEHQHEVTFSKDFFIGTTEVTQAQWQKVMGNNPSSFSRNGSGSASVRDVKDADLANFPVETVTWADAQAFCKKLEARPEE